MFGIIIFGAKPVERETGSGSFHCPTCRRDATYTHFEARQYATLFFIPLVPYGSTRKYVRCRGCGSNFTVDVLSAPSDEGRFATTAPSSWTCRHCGNTNPLEYGHCVACNRTKVD